MAELISANRIGDSDQCNCWYDMGNGEVAQVFEPCPCDSYTNNQVSNQNNSNMNMNKTRVPSRFGGGKFSGGSQGQISEGFGSNRNTDLVVGLGGSQITRAKTGRSVSYNPLYNKPKYVVSANMRELRRRKVRSQQPLLKLGARRTQ